MHLLVVNNPPANAGDAKDVGLIPGSGRFPEEGNSNPLQYSCLENPMDRGDSWATVHRVSKSWTQLSNMCVIITAQMLTINEYPIGLQSTLIYN